MAKINYVDNLLERIKYLRNNPEENKLILVDYDKKGKPVYQKELDELEKEYYFLMR